MACRLFLFGKDAVSIEKMKSLHAIGRSGLLFRSNDPDLFCELKPGISAIFKLQEFRTNSKGLRDKEYSIEKPVDTFRIAVIGDSFSMPAGVSIEDAYHSLLETSLNSLRKAQRYEVINFAVAGYAPRQYLALLRNRTPHYDLGAWSRESGKPVVIIFLSVRPRNSDWISQMAEEEQSSFIDATSAFSGTKASEFFIFPGDSHPNPKAQRIYSETILKNLIVTGGDARLISFCRVNH